MTWFFAERPGFFGRRRAEKIAALNEKYGRDNWQLRHVIPFDYNGVVPCSAALEPGFPVKIEHTYDFPAACVTFYEESYYRWLKMHPEQVDFICQFKDVYDNDISNIQSGLDYTHQHDAGSYATHIQDIAIRCVLNRLGRTFTGANGGYLQIRGHEAGQHLNPGHVPFFNPSLILQPSLRPTWAKEWSVEDMWQSNKVCLVRKT
jgi:hypothetical protein